MDLYKRERERERESWRISTKYILQGANIVKCIKPHRLRWYGNVERVQN